MRFRSTGMPSWILLKRTVKPGDGVVSRWINRRVSRPMSAFLLMFPSVRPLHGTIGTALIGIAMVIALLTGTYAGMVAGALLFQFASIFDGVDGEIARVTFRSTPAAPRSTARSTWRPISCSSSA